jgi:hypothetical protein
MGRCIAIYEAAQRCLFIMFVFDCQCVIAGQGFATHTTCMMGLKPRLCNCFFSALPRIVYNYRFARFCGSGKWAGVVAHGLDA